MNDGSSSLIEAEAEPTFDDELDDEPPPPEMYRWSDVFRLGIGMLLRLDGDVCEMSIALRERGWVRVLIYPAVIFLLN